MNILICDDQDSVGRALASALEAHYGAAADIRCYNDIGRLLDEIKGPDMPEPDIIFMDIMLDGRNGCIEAGEIARVFPFARFIFVTGYPEAAADIFAAVRPSNILLKPVDPGKLIAAADKALRERADDLGAAVYAAALKSAGTAVRLYEIIYAASSGRRLTLHTDAGDVVFYHRLGDFVDETGGYFVRCHQSFAINPRRVRTLTAGSAVMDDGSQVDVSRARYAELRDRLLELSGG